MNYYKVRIGIDSKWKPSSYTYSSENKIQKHSLVRVPFGKKNKWAIIDSETNKPKFSTKDILSVFEGRMYPGKSLSFINWYINYYAVNEGLALTQFLPGFLSKPKNRSSNDNSIEQLAKPPKLNQSQEKASKTISSTKKPTILHGITGSGKTRLYIKQILDQLKKDKSCLLLLPEISLTSQIVNEVSKYVKPLLLHSGLTDKQRSETWFSVMGSSKPKVVIGTRSALFLPFKSLGLVIIDEAHDSSYKQDTGVRYNGIYTAAGLSKSHEAKLLIGSATPPVVETHQVLSSGGNIVCMHDKAIKSDKTKSVSVINKKDKSQFKRNSLISDILIESIQKSLSEDKQSLIFLNRRGTAKLMLCSECEWLAECQACELPLTYHHDIDKLVCHTCGKRRKTHSSCPLCTNKVELRSLGTKALTSEIIKLFSGAKIERYDSDNSKSDSFVQNYEKISKGEVDIIIGTQQLVKGLDLPLLSTVGVVDADTSLNFPDFSSDERTFQLISQVSGRVGRGHGDGRIFIQSYQPNNLVIQLAKNEDWHKFYEEEVKLREKHDLPPFNHISKFIFRDKDINKASKAAENAKRKIDNIAGVAIDGPILSYFPKRSGYYYIQLHAKSKSRSNLIKCIEKLDAAVIVELDPITLL